MKTSVLHADKIRADKILRQFALLDSAYPGAQYYLDFDTPFHLLLATILSAQCTDVVVNRVTKRLFPKYHTPQDVLASPIGELEKDIASVTFAAAKAKHIRSACETLIRDFGSVVPRDIGRLTTLAGVGRKTANAIQQNAFGIVEGVIVDTHVIRIAQRLGWTKEHDPVKIERDLMDAFDRATWKHLPHVLKAHGQKTCTAKSPKCVVCPVADTCPSRI